MCAKMTRTIEDPRMTESMLVLGLNGETVGEMRVRKTREGKPKSRNGCRTCKLRRVKCDETKPHCMRCTRFGQRCDGYIAKAPSKQSLQISTTRTLAPRNPNSREGEGMTTTGAGLSPSVEGEQGPSASPSPVDGVGGGFGGGEAVERFCRESRVVGGVVGEGVWREFLRGVCERDQGVREVVVGVGDVLSDESFGVEGGLTRDLLFFVFERFGDKPDEKVLGGLRSLRELAGEAFAEKKEKLKIAFDGLEERYLSATVGTGKYFPSLNPMPQTFETVDEARTSLELVVRRSKHFLRTTQTERERAETENDYKRWDISYGPLLKFARSKGSSEENFLAASMLRLSWLAGWLCTTFKSEEALKDEKDKRQFGIEIDELTSIAELLLKKMAPEDSEMGNEDENEKVGWAWDMQIAVPVMVVGWLCKNTELRQLAGKMLAKSERREGVCDGVLVCKVLEWLRILEAGHHIKAPFFADGCTVKDIRVAFDVEKRVALVKCLRTGWYEGVEGSFETDTEIQW